jgi:hypothetical protein
MVVETIKQKKVFIVMLSVIMLNVSWLNVMAPQKVLKCLKI